MGECCAGRTQTESLITETFTDFLQECLRMQTTTSSRPTRTNFQQIREASYGSRGQLAERRAAEHARSRTRRTLSVSRTARNINTPGVHYIN